MYAIGAAIRKHSPLALKSRLETAGRLWKQTHKHATVDQKAPVEMVGSILSTPNDRLVALHDPDPKNATIAKRVRSSVWNPSEILAAADVSVDRPWVAKGVALNSDHRHI